MAKYKTNVLSVVLMCVMLLYNINANTINEDHEIKLNEEHDFVLKWRVDEDDIYFEMSAVTGGYIAIGFSPNGGMPGSDIVAGWVKSGEAFLSDRHAITYSKPIADLSDDYDLLYGYEDGGRTTIGFKRKLETCDKNYDYTVSSDTARLIWAINDNDPVNIDDLMYHGSSRGVRSVLLLDRSSETRELPEDVGYFDILMPNVTIPDDKDTTYWCASFEVPKFDQPVNVIRFDGIVQEGHESVVHHMIMYGCRGNLSAVLGWSTECDRDIMPPDLAECRTIIYAWAIGSRAFEFPEHVGLPFGGEDDPTFMFIQLHYDNPGLSSDFHDNSGLRVYYTPILRQYIADVWMIGETVSLSHMIPPNESEFTTYGFCFGECTEYGMTEDIHVFAAGLHAHLAARQINVQQYREGSLIDEIRDDNYDFNLQETRLLKSEKTFKRGDSYLVSCTYNTVGRDNITVGGEGTNEEMCLSFIYYYPKQTDIDYCQSSPSLSRFWEVFEIPYDEKIDYGNFYDYTYRYVLGLEPERWRTGLRKITDGGKRYNHCFNSKSEFLGTNYEVDIPEWFINGTDQRITGPDVCRIDDDNEPVGDGNTLRSGYCVVVTTIGIVWLLL